MFSFLFGFAMLTMSSFGFWGNPDGTIYPDSQLLVAKSIFVGKMTCSVRLLDWENLQHWCVKGTRVAINEVLPIDPNAVLGIDYSDNKLGEPTAAIHWLIAYVEGNPHTVAYVVDYTPDAGNGQPRKQLSGQF